MILKMIRAQTSTPPRKAPARGRKNPPSRFHPTPRPAAHAAARHPHRETTRVMVAPAALLAHRRAAKFAAPDHQRRIEQSPRFQIRHQARDGLGHRAAEFGVLGLQLRVAIPTTAGAAVELHETHAVFHEPPREQTVAAKDRRAALVDTIETTIASGPNLGESPRSGAATWFRAAPQDTRLTVFASPCNLCPARGAKPGNTHVQTRA